MSDTSTPLGKQPPRAALDILAPATDDVPRNASLATGRGDVLHVVEERATVTKRRRSIGSVRVGTVTETVETTAEADLERYRVEVTRVPVGRVVDVAPEARTEGDTTIIPVIEERLVLIKELVLVEEVRIRHVLEREMVSEPVTLRRQRAVVDRLDLQGRAAPDKTRSEGDAAFAFAEGHHGPIE